MATGILLHSYTHSLSSNSSDSSIASTSKPNNPASQPRRIRFAPLPDPRRAVLITDDGDELPIAVSPDDELKCIPASLLVLSPPASPLPRTNEIRNDPSDERENSSGSSTNSYLSSSSSTSASSASTPRTTTPSDASPLSSLTSSPVTTNSALPAPKSSPPLLASQNPPSSWPKPRNISLLRPFKRSSASSSGSSSHSLTPTPSIEASQGHTPRKGINLSPEEILTLGAINLFRTSSRESSDSASTATHSGWGLGLSRWTSANGTDKSANILNGSSPLARTQSTQSYKSKSKFFPSTSSLASEPKSVSQPAHSNVNRHKGTRMLNGRVYGSKRPSANANHFATARDTDDEFVEWGYGGMGSVKGAKSAGMAGSGGVNWERLHGGAGVNGRAPKQGVGGAAVAVAADDDDDGSGMGWVKRRREERERKKKEEEEKAAREKEKETLQVEEEVTESKMSTPTPTRTSTMDGGMFIPKEQELEDPTSAATVVPTSYVEEAVGNGEMKEGFVFGGTVVDEPEQEKEREHVPVVVPVLMRPRHHHHHSSSYRHGRSMSGSGIKSKEVAEEETAFVADREEAVVAEVHHDSKRESVSSSSTSESEDDTDDDEEEDEGGDERDDDEDDEEEEGRKTALGAGVEKVSRHKE